MKYRIRSIEYIGEKLDQYGIPYLKPTGGHAIYLDAKAFLPHIPVSAFPGQALCAALYLEGGIRGVEIGSVMFGEHAQQELVRLAIPRRTYTQSHMDYLTEVIIDVFEKRKDIRGMKIVYEAPYLRHFTARFEPI